MPGAAAGTAGVLGSPGRSGGRPPPRRTRVVLPRFGRYAIARSAWAVMVKDGLTPQIRRDRGAVDDVQPVVAVDPVVGIEHTGFDGPADRAAADHLGQPSDGRLPAGATSATVAHPVCRR